MSWIETIWTDERIELIAVRWREGFSASQIATELGNGISRNAVIGKIHRLGLTGPNTQGPNSATRYRQTLPRSTRSQSKTPFVPRVVEAIAPEAIGPMNDFPGDGCCRYINEHPSLQPWRCCGQPGKTKLDRGAVISLPFCDFHWALTHQLKHFQTPVEPTVEPVPLDERPGAAPVRNGGYIVANRKRVA